MSCWEMLTLTILLLSSAALLVRGQDRSVKAIEGQTVTLPCSYKVTYSSDITAMCWGRGACPNSKCTDFLIWTDGHKITDRSSQRYQLNGQIKRGDVSLTFGQANLTDSGTYCCRIEHRGWFNDEKINIKLNVEKAPSTTRPPTTTAIPVLKTTQLPTTAEATTPPTTPARITTPIPALEETTLTPTTPAGTATASPALTTLPPLPTPWPLPESSPKPPTPIPYELTTAIQQPLATDNSTHENLPEATEHLIPGTIPPLSPHPDENGMADLLSGNTTVVEKESGLPLHILITAICLSVIAAALASMILIKLRWRKRGRYPVGFDPNLELVTHAEESAAEPEVSQTVTLEADSAEANKTKTSEPQNSNKTEA